MLIRVFIVFFGLTLLLADPADAYARKKRRVYKKRSVVLKPKKFIHYDGNFSILFPSSHGEIKGTLPIYQRHSVLQNFMPMCQMVCKVHP